MEQGIIDSAIANLNRYDGIFLSVLKHEVWRENDIMGLKVRLNWAGVIKDIFIDVSTLISISGTGSNLMIKFILDKNYDMDEFRKTYDKRARDYKLDKILS